MITHSTQRGTVDALRVSSILQRDIGDDIRDWYRQFDLEHAAPYIRIPAQPERGMLARVCVPVRHSGMLLGYLWIIDADETVGDRDAEVALATAQLTAVVLYRERRLEGITADALRDLLSRSPQARRVAADELADLELLDPTSEVTAMVVDPGAGYRALHRRLPPQFVDAISRARRRLFPPHTLLSERECRAVLLLPAEAGRSEDEVRLGALLIEDCRRELEAISPGVEPTVGIGARQAAVHEAHRSFRQAMRAAEAAPRLALGRVVSWPRLGPYRVLLDTSPPADGEDGSTVLDPGLERVLAADSGALVETLETYLDLAGDAGRTSAALSIHRTTLYQRLARIEELSGESLRDGLVRLSFHLSLKLARLRPPAHR